jgi:hypothetical protein
MLTAHGRAETIAAWPEGSKQPTLRTTIQKWSELRGMRIKQTA